LTVLASSGGKLVNMPFWEDLSGDDEVLSDKTALTVGKIEAGQDVAALLDPWTCMERKRPCKSPVRRRPDGSNWRPGSSILGAEIPGHPD
jgi:hypothetical protein